MYDGKRSTAEKILYDALEKIKTKKNEDESLELQDKVDTLRIYVEDVINLKEEEKEASSFTIIGKLN